MDYSRFLGIPMLLVIVIFFSSSIANEVIASNGSNSTSLELNTQHVISLKLAQQIATATQADCSEKGFPVTVSILNKDGIDILLARGDGTTGASVEVARDKAYAATGFQSPTSALEERAKTSSPGIIAVEGFTVLPGGLPIKVNDELIGGIGVSGAPSGKIDEACANAGLATIGTDIPSVNASDTTNAINNQLTNTTSQDANINNNNNTNNLV
ncbi:heme-binding protein [Candidatus Nitrosocosmicus sp. SS]|nr:heme-binding protein [Candidatus Nitrosocosmicus sp. SS]